MDEKMALELLIKTTCIYNFQCRKCPWIDEPELCERVRLKKIAYGDKEEVNYEKNEIK